MENKKIYEAPLAQIVLFAPREDIGAFFGNNPWWNLKDNSAWWGLKTEASVVTGTLGVADEDGNTWSYDGIMNKSN